MEAAYDTKYTLEFALVVDSSADMAPFMPRVKEFLRKMTEEVPRLCRSWERDVHQVRVRLIDFADYETEGEEAIRETRFFTLPEEEAEFTAALDAIATDGRGGNGPKNGLEALYTAMTSDWTPIRNSLCGRHVIVLVSNACPLRLHERAACAAYPREAMPKTVEELEDVWREQDEEKTTKFSTRGKRLCLIVPEDWNRNGHTWTSIDWELSAFTPWDAECSFLGDDTVRILSEIIVIEN